MNIQTVLAFDIDGTLTKRNQYEILPHGLSNIFITLSGLGHACIPVTGKPAPYATRLLDDNRLIDCGVIAENAGVYRKPKSSTVSITEEESLPSMFALRTSLGIEKSEDGGVRTIKIHDNTYEVAVDPEDISILTIFTDPKFISHRWKFNHSIIASVLCRYLTEHISKNKWNEDLEILPPFPDGGVQVIRKSKKTGKAIDKSLLPNVVKKIFDLDSIVPIAMFGDGHNDIPAMSPKEVTPMTFVNAEDEVKRFVMKKKGFVSTYKAPDDLGIVDGLLWLAKHNVFQNDSNFIRDVIEKQFPTLHK